MAAFDIAGFDNLEFTIPAGRDKTITLSVPPLDCLTAAQVEDMNNKLDALNEDPDLPDNQKPAKDGTGAAMVRFSLKYFNTTKDKTAAIDNLVPRQLREIDRIWAEESGITLGESEPSTPPSSEEDEE